MMPRLRRLLTGSAGPSSEDRIEQPSPLPGWRWGLLLAWFMRALALLWLMKGLSAWSVILGIWTPAVEGFEARETGYQAIIIYFAVVDLVAAVGLWLVSTWGGVMWLLAVMSYLIFSAFFPSVLSSNLVISGLFLILVVVYLAVSWLSARDE